MDCGVRQPFYMTQFRSRLPYVIVCAALVTTAVRWAWAAGSKQDQPWEKVALELIARADSGHEKEVEPLLQKRLPDITRSLNSDSRRVAWKNLWGRSINFDELANGVIVHSAILRALDAQFKSGAPLVVDHVRHVRAEEPKLSGELIGKPSVTDPAGHELAHAGLEHTYGYLFSILKTSFGFKRARWVEGEIDRGFGFKPGTIGPRPPSGTLFANVTYLGGRIAFRNNDARTGILKKNSQDVPAELREFDFSKLKPTRLEETVEAKDTSGTARKVVLRTDLVPFLHPQKNSHLLVYSVEDPSEGGHVLVTMFPVQGSFVESVLKAGNLGENKPVQTRYNAFVEGVTGQKLAGTRKVVP